MTCREKLMQEHPEMYNWAINNDCPSNHGFAEDPSPDICGDRYCKKCWDREATGMNKPVFEYRNPEVIAKVIDVKEENGGLTVTTEPIIKDSGDRTQFETGAVRDMREGKGRCALMPLEVVSYLYPGKQQNIFLKALEDTSSTAYFILIANSEAGILNTILNRCIKYTFEPYSKEEIEQITGTLVNDLAYKIFKTPGKLLNMTDTSFQSITDLANNLIKNINKATYANSLVISTKINYKDLYNKIDFNLFLDTVEYLSFEDYKNSANEQNFIIYKITNQFKQYATKQNLIKETLMLNYLTTLWEAIHDFNRT